MIDNKTIKAKEKDTVELNSKTTTIINNPQINNVSAIPFNKETNATTVSDKNHDKVNDTSFIDKLVKLQSQNL